MQITNIIFQEKKHFPLISSFNVNIYPSVHILELIDFLSGKFSFRDFCKHRQNIFFTSP